MAERDFYGFRDNLIRLAEKRRAELALCIEATGDLVVESCPDIDTQIERPALAA